MLIRSGRVSVFIMFVLITVSILYWIRQSLKGNIPAFRKLVALEAVEEVVGRAVEMGRPVMLSPGMGDIVGNKIASTLAGLSVVSYAARLCAKLGVRPIVPLRGYAMVPLATALVKEAYEVEGKAEEFSEDMVPFISPETPAYAAGILGLMWREKIGGFIFVGYAAGPTITIFETAQRVGAIKIGGTDSLGNMPFVAACSEFAFIGEEIYAAGAYIGDEPTVAGCLVGQDIGKWIALILITIGAILTQVGIDISTILKY